MSSIPTPAPAVSPSLGDLVTQALSGPPVSDGQLQTVAQPETPPVEPPPVVTNPAPEVTGAPVEAAPVGAEPPTEEPIEPFSLGLDDDLKMPVTPEGEAQPEVKQEAAPKPPSVVEEVLEELASTMTRAEAEKQMSAILRLPKGREMLAALKQNRAVAEKIGFLPTPEEIISFQQSHVEHSRFLDDFSSGDPQRQLSVISDFFGARPDGQVVLGSEEFVTSLPAALKQVNPQLYERLAAPIMEEAAQRLPRALMAELRSNAQRIVGEDDASRSDRARLEDAANIIEAVVNQSSQAVQETPNERAYREQLLRERTERQSGAASAIQHQRKVATGLYFGNLQKSAAADVAAALEPVKSKVDDVTFTSYQESLLRQVNDHMRAYHANEAVKSRLGRAFEEAAQRKDPNIIRNEIDRARKAYEVKIGELRVPFLKAASRVAVDAARATADKLQQSQHKTETTQPVSASSSGVSIGLPARKEGETASDYKRRAMDAVFST